MKPIKLVFLLAIACQACIITKCSSQSFHLIKATGQHWAGGVAGHYGINYYIEIETPSKTMFPDTVWINGRVYPLVLSDKQGSISRSLDSVTHQIRYVISVGESQNYFNRGPRLPADSQKDNVAEKPKHIRSFAGAAMISYVVKHKEHFFIVKQFKQLDALNYP